MDDYGKRNGVKYAVVDTLGEGVNGMYDSKSDTIYVSLDASEGDITRAATHEGWHRIKQNIPTERIESFQQFILNTLSESEDYDLDVRIRQIQDAYKAQVNQTLTREDAIEEIVADSMFDVFADKNNMKRFMQKDLSLTERIINWLKQFSTEMKNMIKRIAHKSPEAKAMLQKAEYADVMVETYNDLMREAQTAQRIDAPQRQAASLKGERYSLDSYTEHEVDNWKNSKRTVIYESKEQQSKFVDQAVADKTFQGKMVFGKIDSDFADAIYKATGVNVKGDNLALGGDEVRKILKDHGNEANESARGQRAITKDDLRNVADTILSATQIERSQDDYNGRPAIVFTNNDNGKVTTVTYSSARTRDLAIKTMYASKKGYKNRDLSTVKSSHVPSSQTPEATSGRVSNHSIHENAENSKRKFSLKDTIPTEADQLLAENNDLRKAVGQLREMLEEVQRQENDPKAIRRIAKDIIEQTGSHYSARTLAQNLQSVYDVLANQSDTSAINSSMNALTNKHYRG